MMGRGTYIGGHTVFGPGSDWFGYEDPPKRKRRKKGKRGPAITKPKKPSKRDLRFQEGEVRRAEIAAGAAERATKRASSNAEVGGEARRPSQDPAFTVERKKLSPRPRSRKQQGGEEVKHGDQD